MTRVLKWRAGSAIWLAFAAAMWCTSQTAIGSIMESDDGPSDNLSADHEVGALDNDSESSEPAARLTGDAAAPIRIDPPGDYDGSGLVEQSDLDLVLTNWGREVDLLPTTWVNERPAALVDQSALDQVLMNWGKTATFTSPVAHMPEASSMTVALLLIGSVVGARAAYKGIERRRSPVA